MTNERIAKLALCTAFIAISIYVILTTGRYVDPLAGRYAGTLGTEFMPTLWAYVLLLLSLLYGAQVLFFEKSEPTPELTEAALAARRLMLIRIAGTIALVLGYALVLRQVHFIPLTSVFLFLTLLLYGQYNVFKTGLAALLGGFGFYGIFVMALRIPL